MTAAAVATPRPEVLLIDLSSLYWTAYHATAAESSSEATKLTQTAIDRCIGELDGKLVAICVDEGRSFRKDLSPDYKANRPEKDQSALAELAKLKERLRERGYWLAGASGFEADDVIATLATAASAAGHPVRIASSDKDLLQLLALPCSSMLRTHTWRTWRAADVVTELGVEPEGLRDWLALVGDKSDNITGCPSVGPKTATALLIAHYDIDNLYDKINALGPATKTPDAAKIATPAVLEKLKAHKADVMLARKLVTLRTDAPVKFDDIYEKREPKKGTDMGVTDVEYDDPRISGPTPKDEPEPPKAESAGPTAAAPVASPSAPAADDMTAPVQTKSEQVALTVIPGPFEMQLEPTSLGIAFKLGQALYESRLYTRLPTAQSITAVIVRGREMGIGALTALDCFHVVEGKPYASAHLMIARAKADPDCEYFQLIESTAELATWETKNRRNPKPTRYTYTIGQAIKAGLLMKEKNNWNTRPEDMLIKTSGAKLAKIEYTSSAIGLTSIEELGGES
jgi:5'-3' exonuclease